MLSHVLRSQRINFMVSSGILARRGTTRESSVPIRASAPRRRGGAKALRERKEPGLFPDSALVAGQFCREIIGEGTALRTHHSLCWHLPAHIDPRLGRTALGA